MSARSSVNQGLASVVCWWAIHQRAVRQGQNADECSCSVILGKKNIDADVVTGLEETIRQTSNRELPGAPRFHIPIDDVVVGVGDIQMNSNMRIPPVEASDGPLDRHDFRGVVRGGRVMSE